jgi:hypothetical protein
MERQGRAFMAVEYLIAHHPHETASSPLSCPCRSRNAMGCVGGSVYDEVL